MSKFSMLHFFYDWKNVRYTCSQSHIINYKSKMEVGLTVGIFRSSYWVYVLLVNDEGDYTGGGNICQTTKKMLSCIKSVKGAVVQYMKFGKFNEFIWIVPFSHHDELCETLRKNDISVEPVPVVVRSIISRKCDEKVDNVKLEGLVSYHRLRPVQKSAVTFMIQAGGRALNASEMGTGKTATGVCISEYYSNFTPQLIVCPSSLKHNWKSEFNKFSKRDIPIITNGNDDFSDISIISYSLLTSPKIAKKLSRFKVIIMDESHYIKSSKSLRSRLLLKLTKHADKVILLTGTPSSKSVDLFTQLKTIDSKHFTTLFPYQGKPSKDVFYFANRYCDPTKVYLGRNRFGFKFDGNTREWELHAVLSKYMTRTTKNQSLSHLPAKTRERVIIEELSEQKKKKIKADLQKIDVIREEKGSRQAEFKLMEMVRDTAVCKVKHVVNYIRFIIDKGDNQKYLIFAHHKIIIDAVVDLMEKNKQKFITIDGRTKTDKRQVLVDSFQNDEDVKYAVLSIKAAGVGLNLFKANAVIFCELLWSEKDHIQAEDRVHRSGLQHPVLVQYLIMGGTTDDIIWRTLSRKVETAGAVIDNKRTFLKTDQSSTFENNSLKRQKTRNDNKLDT